MNADSSIPEFVTTAIDYGNQLIAAWQRNDKEAAAQRQAEEAAEIAADWQPVLATIHQATPSWVHPYIVTPDSRPYDYGCLGYYLLPAVIDLSALLADIPTMRVWARPHVQNPMIRFETGRYSLALDKDAGQWFVATRFDTYKATSKDLSYFVPGIHGATDAFHVALARAVADRTDLSALQEEADRLNVQDPVAAVAEPVEAVAAVDPLARIADALERLTALYEANLPY